MPPRAPVSIPFFSSDCFNVSYVAKLIATYGATPIIETPMPLYSARNPSSLHTVTKQFHIPVYRAVYSALWPGKVCTLRQSSAKTSDVGWIMHAIFLSDTHTHKRERERDT